MCRRFTLEHVAEFDIKDKASEEMVHFNTYKAIVPTTEFEVHEGVGSEVYTTEDALKRSDLTPSARKTIVKSQEK